MKKRGYFFALDSILGLGVLVIGVFLIFSTYAFEQPKVQTSYYSEDLISYLANTKIKDINSKYSGIGGTLWKNGNITNEENTLLQQIGEFYEFKNWELLSNFTNDTTKNLISLQYEFEIWLNESLVYPRDPSLEHNQSKNSSDLLLSSRRIVYGILDKRTGDLWGPYETEVLVWQIKK
jgi:hypothetical protein